MLGNECAAEREKRKNRIDGIETRWYGQDGGDGTRRHAVDGPRVVEPVFGKKTKNKYKIVSVSEKKCEEHCCKCNNIAYFHCRLPRC